ncbi:PaaI family thioesterase [Pontixanthobacter aquaemixtae]|uniref:Hotdog fold thioesterase n=1 Tax=Pontixanthobacter aquaemixtae TaxID=1958940 RepID=A0A844ZQW5_9SPHN|nr:PaaI family thioesterase [Pontixanthobacter aquaemixtae]MXO90138.1 hotdog fold thioesterase [Pontixanthobacter aquaemixtae]
MAGKNEDLNPLYKTMGLVRIVEMDKAGRARLEYNARKDMCHSGGVVQGGFVSGWIDAAMAHAAIALNGPDVVPMSLELKVSFFAPTRPGLVIAEGWVEKGGRRTGFYEGCLKDENGTVLAKGTSTIMFADREKVESASKRATAG